MPVTNIRDQYENHSEDWSLMEESLQGEWAIKKAGTGRLPKTAGQIEAEVLARTDESEMTPAEAQSLYLGYKERAEYPLWVKDSLRAMMGLVGRQEPTIKLPRAMASLEKEATADGFNLKQLFLRTVSATLTKGRKPLVANFDGDGKPYVSAYTAESAINWKESAVGGRKDLSLVVLKEAQPKNQVDEFSHDAEDVYRVLDLQGGQYRVRLLDGQGQEIEEEQYPGRQAGETSQPLNFIPLVFVGSTDNSADCDEIPLLTMAKAALKYYQLSADYYTALHYTAHPQPWVSGLDDDTELRVTGPMAAWMLPKDGQADYLEFQGAGIEATRKAMEAQRNSAAESGARVIDVQGVESGDARKARQNDQYTSLYSVVVTAAEGIEQVLKYIASWLGLNPDEVEFSVEPKFSREEVDAAMMQIVATMVMAGEVPRKVLFEVLRKAQLTDLPDEKLEALRETGDAPDDDDLPVEDETE